MSKYTIEVRYICEKEAGLKQSTGYNNVDNTIIKAIPKIFSFPFPIFDENYRVVLEKKILKHFYLREIGHETVGLWKLALDTKLNEIMPYYNKLYESELIKFNPLYDVDYKVEKDKNVDTDIDKTNKVNSNSSTDNTLKSVLDKTGTNKIDSTSKNTNATDLNDNSNTANSQNLERRENFADTPQGLLTAAVEANYLTEATFEKTTDGGNSSTSKHTFGTVTDNGSNNSTNTLNLKDTKNDTQNIVNETTKNETEDKTINTTEDYLEHVYGKKGTKNYAQMIIDLRNTFLNIDMMIIKDLEELFFLLW